MINKKLKTQREREKERNITPECRPALAASPNTHPRPLWGDAVLLAVVFDLTYRSPPILSHISPHHGRPRTSISDVVKKVEPVIWGLNP